LKKSLLEDTFEQNDESQAESGAWSTNRKWVLVFLATHVLLLSLVFIQAYHQQIPVGTVPAWLPSSLKHPTPNHDKDCSSESFTKETLKLVTEEVVVKLAGGRDFDDDPLSKFEASGIEASPDGLDYYVVFDNSYYIGKFHSELSYVHHRGTNSTTNSILPWPGKSATDDSGFESISYNKTSGTFLVVQEALTFDEGIFSRIFDISIDPISGEITIVDTCEVDFEFTHENKGFEGSAIFHHPTLGRSFLLGLCEGNFCEGGERGKMGGNGKVVVMDRTTSESGGCLFKTVSTVDIPSVAMFEDYSDMTVQDGKIIIVSQASSAMWVGEHLHASAEDGHWAINGEGAVYDFPRNDNCEVKYCNIEGVFLEQFDKVTVVSDQMKSKGKQSFKCWEKDQSLHSFLLPPS